MREMLANFFAHLNETDVMAVIHDCIKSTSQPSHLVLSPHSLSFSSYRSLFIAFQTPIQTFSCGIPVS